MPRRGRGGGAPAQVSAPPQGSGAAAPAQSPEYGEITAREEAQQVVPVRPPPSTPVAPGDLPSLADPSQRGNEPITTGVDIGPGGGSDILATNRMRRPQISPITQLAQQVDDPYLHALARYFT